MSHISVSGWVRRIGRERRVREILKRVRRLMDSGSLEAADALIQDALGRYPDHPELLVAAARIALRSGSRSLAITRWTQALASAPDCADCHIGLAAALRLSGDIVRAFDTIATARQRFPSSAPVLAEAGRIAEARADLAGALEIWQMLCRAPGAQPEWQQRLAMILVHQKRFEEAQAFLDVCLAPLTSDEQIAAVRALYSVRGMLASARQDWPAALAFWTDFRLRFPDSTAGWQQLGRALEGQAFALNAPASDQDTNLARIDRQAEIAVITTDSVTRRLLLTFESLGASCEFGLVQRRYAAEPLGLLRWNDVSLDQLVLAVSADFAGLGEPETTELVTRPNGEFMVRDVRWGFDMHTWIFVGQEDRDALYLKMCQRLRFLKDKLLADLSDATKTFVFLSEGVPVARLETLHRVLQRFGPVRLLAVQPVGATTLRGTAGHVIKIAEGLFVGFIDHLGQRDNGDWDIAFDDWVAVCNAVKSSAEV